MLVPNLTVTKCYGNTKYQKENNKIYLSYHTYQDYNQPKEKR